LPDGSPQKVLHSTTQAFSGLLNLTNCSFMVIVILPPAILQRQDIQSGNCASHGNFNP
jgi:hypothetical protein